MTGFFVCIVCITTTSCCTSIQLVHFTVQTVAEEDVDEGDDYQYYTVGDKTICISTAHTEEKINALNMLACYAEHLQEHFAPYCAEVASIVEHVMTVPLLNDEDMRSACAGLVPLLLEDMQLAWDKGTWQGATDVTVREMYELLMKSMLKVRGPLHAQLLLSIEIPTVYQRAHLPFACLQRPTPSTGACGKTSAVRCVLRHLVGLCGVSQGPVLPPDHQRHVTVALQAMDIEMDPTVIHCIYDSLDDMVDVASDGLISEQTMQELFKRIKAQVGLLMDSRADREKEADEDDVDEEDLEQLQEVEEEEDALLEQVPAPLLPLVPCSPVGRGVPVWPSPLFFAC